MIRIKYFLKNAYTNSITYSIIAYAYMLEHCCVGTTLVIIVSVAFAGFLFIVVIVVICVIVVVLRRSVHFPVNAISMMVFI